jgi:hypothetical protein
MSDITSILFVDEQQVAVATSAKRKEEDVVTVAQATAATAHREQEALIATVAATRKTLDEAQTRERAAALA